MNSVTRRSFLKTPAAVAASAAMPRKASANDRVHVSVIGCRNRGTTVASIMLRSGDFNVATICDCDDEMVAKALADDRLKDVAGAISQEKDSRRLLDDQSLDAVIVATPDHWHAAMTVMYQFPELTMLWELRHWTRFMPGGGHGNCCEIDGGKGSLIIHQSGWKFYLRDKTAEVAEDPGSDLDGSHVRDLAQAVRGEARFSAPIVEGHKSAVLCHLGNIAARLNRRVQFHPVEQTIVGDSEAEAMMGREYRKPWSLAPCA